MKKLNYFLIAVLTVFAFSCNNDTDDPPTAVIDAPTINAPSVATTVQVGKVVTMTFGVNAPGTVAEVTVATTGGTAVITSASIVGETTGNVEVTFTAPLTDGTETVTLTVKDAQATPKSTDGTAPVTVTLAATSDTDLLVTQFASAPVFDGVIDDMWNTAQQLVSFVEVPSNLGNRNTYYNEAGIGEQDLDIFEAYEAEKYDFTMRAGTFGSDIYFLIEWADDEDSKDRQSWYFDDVAKLWKGQHKYANDANDKYYEDKFAFLFPITEVVGFSSATCYATCHTASTINKDKDKHTRHYLKNVDEKIDMWHWKRVRGTYLGQVDDQKITYEDEPWNSSTNGRHGDGTGSGGYANNSQTLTITGTATEVSVPMYVIPGATEYFWIDPDQIADGTAKKVMEVDANGVLTLDDASTIDPADGGFEDGTGNKRMPSILTSTFTEGRGDISIQYMHTGTGWVCEVKRALNTNDEDDVIFANGTELDFGFAIFNNAAIGHAIKPGLKLKWE